MIQLGMALGFTTVTSCRTPMPPPLRLEAVDREAVVKKAAAHGLVPVSSGDPGIAVDQRYATADNAFRRVLYPAGFPVLISAPTAGKLAVANAALRPRGLHLLVWDAYRPPEVQWRIFQLFQSENYVADPRKKWSKHCYGRAVDLTLADGKGQAVPMPGAFDDFTAKASATYTGNDPAVRRNLELLQKVMRDAGFTVYVDEWWHFTDLSCKTLKIVRRVNRNREKGQASSRSSMARAAAARFSGSVPGMRERLPKVTTLMAR